MAPDKREQNGIVFGGGLIQHRHHQVVTGRQLKLGKLGLVKVPAYFRGNPGKTDFRQDRIDGVGLDGAGVVMSKDVLCDGVFPLRGVFHLE